MSNPIISLVVVILSLSFAFFYTKPEYDIMQGHRADLAALGVIFSEADSIKDLIAGTQKTLDEVDSLDLDRFSIFLPERVDPIRLANDLQHIGLKNGLVLENIKVEESANGLQKSTGGATAGAISGALQGAVNIFTVGRRAELSQAEYERTRDGTNTSTSATDKKYVSTKASFTFFAKVSVFELFLNDLETSLRLINITGLSFSPVLETADMKKVKTDTQPTYQYTVMIETYSLK